MTDYIEVDFPNWALCRLVNGDPIEDDADSRTFDRWEASMRADGWSMMDFDVTDDTNEFCPYPEFGLACDTTKVRFFRKRSENGKR